MPGHAPVLHLCTAHAAPTPKCSTNSVGCLSLPTLAAARLPAPPSLETPDAVARERVAPQFLQCSIWQRLATAQLDSHGRCLRCSSRDIADQRTRLVAALESWSARKSNASVAPRPQQPRRTAPYARNFVMHNGRSGCARAKSMEVRSWAPSLRASGTERPTVRVRA